MDRSGLVASLGDAALAVAEAAARAQAAAAAVAMTVLETVAWADVAAAVVAVAAATGIGAAALSVSEAAAVAGAATSRPRWERDLIAQAARIRVSPVAASCCPTFSAAACAALVAHHAAGRVQVHDDLAELSDQGTTRKVLFTPETCETGHHGPTNCPTPRPTGTPVFGAPIHTAERAFWDQFSETGGSPRERPPRARENLMMLRNGEQPSPQRNAVRAWMQWRRLALWNRWGGSQWPTVR